MPFRLCFGSASEIWRRSIVVGVPLIAVLGVAFLAEPLFESNDDTGLAMMGAGFGFAVQPDPHVIFSHYGYGVLMNVVSRIAGPHAHGWITLAALALSIALVARSLTEPARIPSLIVWLALMVAGGCVFAKALLAPQFTITSALLFGAAIGCRLVTLRETRTSPLLEMAIYGAVASSFLIRPIVVLSGIVVVGPALVWLAWRGPVTQRGSIRRFMLAIAVMAVLTGISDHAAYTLSPEWRNALEYNQLRSLFNDFYRVPWAPNAPEYRQVGWTHNDYQMFIDWYANHPIYDLGNIKFLAQSLATTPQSLLKLSNVWSWLTAPVDWPILLGLVIVQLLLSAVLRRHRILSLLFLFGGLCAIIIASLSGRPPVFRVWFAVAAMPILCTLPLLIAEAEEFRTIRKVGLGALVAMAICSGGLAIQQHRDLSVRAAAYRTALESAKPYFSGTVISWGATLMWQWLITPTRVYSPIAGLTIPSIGLFARTPIMEATLRRLKIADLGLTLCTEPNIHLIAYDTSVGRLQMFCEEHYGTRPTFRLVFAHARTQIFVSVEESAR